VAGDTKKIGYHRLPWVTAGYR